MKRSSKTVFFSSLTASGLLCASFALASETTKDTRGFEYKEIPGTEKSERVEIIPSDFTKRVGRLA